MAQPFLGEIRPVAFNFAPIGWAMCNGQLMAISQNAALFSLLGTYYGGDGISTFGLPNLQGRVALSSGTSPISKTVYDLGELGGEPTVALTTLQMPDHTHKMAATYSVAKSTNPDGAMFAVPKVDGTLEPLYGPGPTNTTMNSGVVGTGGQGVAHTNMQPFLAITYVIALQGIYPSRN